MSQLHPAPEPHRCTDGVMPARHGGGTGKPWLACALGVIAFAPLGCGGRASSAPPPVVRTVSIADTAFHLANDGSALYIAVIIVAPTETTSFTIGGLPAGVTASYKESESNPSGLLTLTAGPTTPPGTYTPRVTVGSSGQTAATSFTLVVNGAILKQSHGDVPALIKAMQPHIPNVRQSSRIVWNDVHV